MVGVDFFLFVCLTLVLERLRTRFFYLVFSFREFQEKNKLVRSYFNFYIIFYDVYLRISTSSVFVMSSFRSLGLKTHFIPVHYCC